jgi:vitamin B12 transporter
LCSQIKIYKKCFFIKKIFYLLIFIVSTVCESLSKEIPVITISAGKTEQNINTVGSDTSSISENDIEKSSSFFLGNLLHDNLSGMNFSQTEGYGTNSLIKLRRLPKRYTTVYIDGVKMSDPSTPDNAFYFNNITMNGIKSVEILKGSQSSLY